MARRAKSHREPRRNGGLRPSLLAGGFGLMWFVQIQEGGLPGDLPYWGIALLLGGRLFADFVGALVAISALRLILTLARLVVARWRAQRQLEAR